MKSIEYYLKGLFRNIEQTDEVKEQIEEAGALPEELDELMNVYEKSGISIRKK